MKTNKPHGQSINVFFGRKHLPWLKELHLFKEEMTRNMPTGAIGIAGRLTDGMIIRYIVIEYLKNRHSIIKPHDKNM